MVPGRYDKMALENAIKSAPGGQVALKTAEGETLTVADANGAL